MAWILERQSDINLTSWEQLNWRVQYLEYLQYKIKTDKLDLQLKEIILVQSEILTIMNQLIRRPDRR